LDDNKQREIERQVERWDLYARLVPTLFLIVSLILVATGVIDFETAFWVGLGLFACTAVTWWFWTIFTIRLLVKTLHRASKNLGEVREEFKDIAKEVQKLRPDDER
jgi:hypothetical protein